LGSGVMSLHNLNGALERAKDRHRYAKGTARAKQELDKSNPQHARTHSKLEDDVVSAARDEACAVHALDQAHEIEGLNL
jgi:hypothetical protein